MKRLARALAGHAFSAVGAGDLELGRAKAVEIDHAAGVRAVGPTAALWDHQHREVVTVDEADVEEIEAAVPVEGELGESGGRGSAVTGAFYFSGAAIACDAGEFAGGVLGAEGSAPEAAAPGGWGRDGLGLALLESKAGGRKRRHAGVGENARPNCVLAFVHHCECG